MFNFLKCQILKSQSDLKTNIFAVMTTILTIKSVKLKTKKLSLV